jgi:restriction endonuclease Mrr
LPSLDSKFLQQYPEYLKFVGRAPRTIQTNNESTGQADLSQTPEEILQESYQTLQVELSEEMLHA